MPHYDFENEVGEIVEVWMSMSDAPLIGETMHHEGCVLRRIVSHAPSQAAVQRSIEGVVVQQAAAWAPGAKHYVMDPSSTDYGQPVMASRKEVAKFLRENPGGTYGEGLSRIS